MKSLSFPSIFKGTTTNIKYDFEATRQNLYLLVCSSVNEMKDDPQFGVDIKRALFSQNTYILRDLLIDKIYEKILMFMPQLRLKRKDITIEFNKDKGKAFCNIVASNVANNESDTYTLVLFKEN